MTDQAPDYVHRLLDAYLTGELLDFHGREGRPVGRTQGILTGGNDVGKRW